VKRDSIAESGDPCGMPVIVSYSLDLYSSTMMLVRLFVSVISCHEYLFGATLGLLWGQTALN
jgi:hypothetical protein